MYRHGWVRYEACNGSERHQIEPLTDARHVAIWTPVSYFLQGSWQGPECCDPVAPSPTVANCARIFVVGRSHERLIFLASEVFNGPYCVHHLSVNAGYHGRHRLAVVVVGISVPSRSTFRPLQYSRGWNSTEKFAPLALSLVGPSACPIQSSKTFASVVSMCNRRSRLEVQYSSRRLRTTLITKVSKCL